MASNTRDTELRIRARDYSQKTFKDLKATIEALIKAQEAQVKAAEKGETSSASLEKAYSRLNDAAKALQGMHSITKMYEAQELALADAAKETERLRQVQVEAAKAIEQSGEATRKQTADLNRANRDVERANKKEQQRRNTLARTAEQMQRLGISTVDVSRSQKELQTSFNQVNDALERQHKTIDDLSGYQALAAEKARQKKLNDDEIESNRRVVEALTRQAEQAIATSRGYRTLGRTISVHNRTMAQTANSLERIIAPAENARRTIRGLEQQVNGIAKAQIQQSDSANKLRRDLNTLNEAQKSLMSVGKLIDQFRQQTAAIHESRAVITQSRRELREMADEMRKTGSASAEMATRIQRTQQRLNEHVAALRNQRAAARQAQQALRENGVQTNALQAAEQRLVNTANQSTSAARRLTSAINEQGRSKNNATKWTDDFTKSTRTSLSWVQRIRGEIIALTTTYVGLQGAINLASGAIQAYKTREQALIKAAAVVGVDNHEGIAAEWTYITGLAEALGLRIDDLAASYGKFGVSAKEVGLTLQETRFIFESISKAARVYQLSADDTRGVFRALEQMLGKGQVYAEELRQQLGERIPAAVAMFARGMGVSIEELSRRMEDGRVEAAEIINYARANAEAIEEAMAAALESVGAAEDRLYNARFMFNQAIADAGFIDSYVNLLDELTKFLSSEQGQKTAENLSNAFSKLADSLIVVAENGDTAARVLKVLATLAGVAVFSRLASMFARSAVEVKRFVRGVKATTKPTTVAGNAASNASRGFRLLTRAMRILLRLIPVIGIALIGWDIGSAILKSTDSGRKTLDKFTAYMESAPKQWVNSWRLSLAVLEDVVEGGGSKINRTLRQRVNTMTETVAEAAKHIPGIGESLSNALRENMTVRVGTEREFWQETSRIWGDVEQEWDDMHKRMSQTHKRSVNALNVPIPMQAAADWTPFGFLQNQQPGQFGWLDQRQVGSSIYQDAFEFTADPGTGPTPRTRAIEEMIANFEKLRRSAQLAQRAAEEALVRRSLEGRLSLVDIEFEPRFAEIDAIGGEDAKRLRAELETIVELRKEVERLEYQSIENADDRSRERQIQRLNEQYERLAANIRQSEDRIDPSATFEDRMASNLARMEANYTRALNMADTIGGDEGADYRRQFEDLRLLNAELVTQQTKLAEVKHLEDTLKAQLETKRHLYAEVNTMRENGLISEQEMMERLTAIDEQHNDNIRAGIEALREFSELIKDTLSPETFARINAELTAMEVGLDSIRHTSMDMTMVQGIVEGISSSLQTVVTELANAAAGANSWSNAIRNTGAAVARFFADFLMRIAQAIMQQMILNALASGPWGGMAAAAQSMGGVNAAAAASAAPVLHGGGKAGSFTTSGGSRSRRSSWFVGGGGSGQFPGLRSDESLNILQKGEQVLAKGDPDNVLNQSGQSGSGPSSIRMVLVDDRSQIPEAMNSAEGEKVLVDFIRRNRLTVKQLLS